MKFQNNNLNNDYYDESNSDYNKNNYNVNNNNNNDIINSFCQITQDVINRTDMESKLW